MKIPKHQFEAALEDLAVLAKTYTQSRSLGFLKNYNPQQARPEESAYEAGKLAGVVEFLVFAREEAKRSYAKTGVETE